LKKISVILLFSALTSCGFQAIIFNADNEYENAIRLGENYHNKLKNNNEITDFKLVSVKDTKLFVGKCKDTIKQVYTMIYDIKKNNELKRVFVKLKKTKNKLEVTTKNIK
jgi:hypothetical protein